MLASIAGWAGGHRFEEMHKIRLEAYGKNYGTIVRIFPSKLTCVLKNSGWKLEDYILTYLKWPLFRGHVSFLVGGRFPFHEKWIPSNMRAEAQPSTWWWHKCKAHKEAMLMKLDWLKKNQKKCAKPPIIFDLLEMIHQFNSIYWCFLDDSVMTISGRQCHLGHPPNGLQDSISSEAFGQLWINLTQHFTDFQHLSRSATFDFWTTNLRGSFLLVWTFWLHLIWCQKLRLDCAKKASWQSAMSMILHTWMSCYNCHVWFPLLITFCCGGLLADTYISTDNSIDLICPCQMQKKFGIASWVAAWQFPQIGQCSERSVSHQVLQCFPHPRRFQSSLEIQPLFLSAQCSQKNACTGNPWKIHGSSSRLHAFQRLQHWMDRWTLARMEKSAGLVRHLPWRLRQHGLKVVCCHFGVLLPSLSITK